MNVLFFVEVNGTDCAATGIQLDFMNITVRADFAAAGFLRDRYHRSERAGFRFYLATKAETEAAIDAGAAPRAGLRQNCHRRREWIKTNLARGALKKNAARFHRKRRHRIGLGARRIEGAGARET